MKKILLSILLTLSLFGFSQDPDIIGEHKILGSLVANLKTEGNNMVIYYHDYRFRDQKEYGTAYIPTTFITVDSLYNEVQKVFLNKKNRDYKMQYKIGENQFVTIENMRDSGITLAKVSISGGGWFPLDKKGAKKLFGKQ